MRLKKCEVCFVIVVVLSLVKYIDLLSQIGRESVVQLSDLNSASSSSLNSNQKPQIPTQQRSSFRSEQARKSTTTTTSTSVIGVDTNINTNYTNSTDRKRKDKLLFRIGLIVPKTAFSSQYKTYTQRIKDHLLHLSRHQTYHDRLAQNRLETGAGGASNSGGGLAGAKSISSSIQQTIDSSKVSTASCHKSNTAGSSSSQNSRLLPWHDLTFNQHFDIRVVDSVSFAPRSSAQNIIESMCQKLIEQNVSVIVYLENNQDQAVTSSLDSKSFIQSPPTPIVVQPFSSSSYRHPDLTTSAQALANLSSGENVIKSRILSSVANKSSLENHRRQTIMEPRVYLNDSLTRGSSNGPLKTSSQAHFIMHLAHSAGIPMIAWSVTAAHAQRPKKQKTLHLAPTVAHEAEAMIAIMKRYSWYSFSVVSSTLAGHDDFILALRHFMAASNGVSSSASMGRSSRTNGFGSKTTTATTTRPFTIIKPSNSSVKSSKSNSNNTSIGDDNYSSRSSSLDSEILAQPSKTFKLLDVITIRERTSAHIEEEIRKLTISESRVILLYSTRGEAIDILRIANKLKLTKRTYAWIVAQSVIGSNENERAPPEFHPGLLGVYFRSNHERLLDELSRAITIIAHGLEALIRDEDSIVQRYNDNSQLSEINCERAHEGSDLNLTCAQIESNKDFQETLSLTGPLVDQLPADISAAKAQFIINQHHKMLNAHSKCYGKLDKLNEKRRDFLYEYFRKSSPWNEFDADGLLKNVELNVVNLDNERQWRRIGCFSDATLTIDDITWPEQAERPPSGTMEKFHLRAVFLEEPSFLNLADPDVDTGSCKTNRAVRCRYKVARHANVVSKPPFQASTITSFQDKPRSSTYRSSSSHRRDQISQNSEFIEAMSNEEYEYKCCSGFCIDLIEKFATDLKFTYELYRVPDGLWGVLENNTWNGLISELIKGKADIIVSSIKINSDRQSAVDFTEPFLDTGISILVGKQTGVISKLAFLEPFDALAWIMFICVGVPLATASIFFFELLSPNGFYSKTNASHVEARSCQENGSRTSVGHHKFSFCRTLWLVITILFGSAAHIDSPKGYTARFMSNVWATFAVVFLAVYTANLAAFMITREEYLELSGINDSRLAYPYHRHPPLKFGTISGGNTHAVLRANRPNLYEYMRPHNRPTVEDGVEAVKRAQLDAFIYDALVLDYLASQDQECKLVNVGSWYSMTGYALALPRNSRYYDKFNMKMLEYRKNGELDRLRRFWMQGLCKPGQTRHSKSKPLDLSQFMSAFLLLGAGILCSVFVLILEHLYILYIRDRLIKYRHRKQLLKYLYPFSLSLTDSLRLPNYNESSSPENKSRNSIGSEQKYVIKCSDVTTNFEMQNLNEQGQNSSQDYSQEESSLRHFEVHL